MTVSGTLENKIALITGASRGIGKEIAKKFAANGATVIVNYCGSKEKAENLVDEIIKNNGKAVAMQCDISNYKESEKMITEILNTYGRVDILVNNAGITKDNLVMKMSKEDFEQVISTNLNGVFFTIKHLYRNFLKLREGKIINISSVSGVIGNAGQINYSASKAGVIGLTKSLARELASRNICVNAIAPGFIETEMTKNMAEEVLSKSKSTIPLGRLGKAEEVAELALFLAGSTSDYITGQVICVDGGMAI